jgi:serine/threonine protein kinase
MTTPIIDTVDGERTMRVEIGNSVLGSGGYGSVSDGEVISETGVRRACAIKSFRSRKDFLRELRNLRNVRMVQGCIKVIGYVDSSSTHWILLPRGEQSLNQLFQATSERYVAVLESIGTLFEALYGLNDAGYVHLDVKPSNVLHCHAGRYLLIDFGTLRDMRQAQNLQACYSEYGLRAEAPCWVLDVFSAGATALETVVWFLDGREGVQCFRDARTAEQHKADPKDSTPFFDILDPATGRWRLVDVARNRLRELKQSYPEIANVLERMLEAADPTRRITMGEAKRMWKEAVSNMH